MSARDVPLPDLALGEILAKINENLSILERRVTWPGAVHSVFGGAVGVTPSGGWVGGTPAATTLLSVTVDPGRWIFFSTVSISLTSLSASDYPPGGQINSGLVVTSGFLNAQRNAVLSTGSSGSRESSMTNVVDFTSPNPITAVVSAGGNYNLVGYPALDPRGEYSISSSSLIAFPG